jgi:sugar phosphate isomerase/epimerase
MLRDHGLTIVSSCRGGFFPNRDARKRRAAIDDNRRAIEEAAE